MAKIKKWVQQFWNDEEGLGTLEILLIVAVLVGVALLFRGRIMSWVNDLLDKTGSQLDEFDPANTNTN